MIRSLALGAGVATAVAAATGWVIARRLTAPVSPRTFDLTVRRWSRTTTATSSCSTELT